MVNDNICALSTAAASAASPSSGSAVRSPLFFAEKMFRPQGKTAVKDFVPYMLYTGEFDAGSFKDYGMCVYFKAPKSYTGEDMAEYHCPRRHSHRERLNQAADGTRLPPPPRGASSPAAPF